MYKERTGLGSKMGREIIYREQFVLLNLEMLKKISSAIEAYL